MAPLITNSGTVLLHVYVSGGGLQDSAGGDWSAVGTPVFSASVGNYPESVGNFATGNYFKSGTGADALDVTGDFTLAVVFKAPPPGTTWSQNAGVLISNGANGGAGWYLESGAPNNGNSCNIHIPSTAVGAGGAISSGSINVIIAGRAGTTHWIKLNGQNPVTAGSAGTSAGTSNTLLLGTYAIGAGYPPLGNVAEWYFNTNTPSSATFAAIYDEVMAKLCSCPAQQAVGSVAAVGAAEVSVGASAFQSSMAQSSGFQISTSGDVGISLTAVQGEASTGDVTATGESSQTVDLAAVEGTGTAAEVLARYKLWSGPLITEDANCTAHLWVSASTLLDTKGGSWSDPNNFAASSSNRPEAMGPFDSNFDYVQKLSGPTPDIGVGFVVVVADYPSSWSARGFACPVADSTPDAPDGFYISVVSGTQTNNIQSYVYNGHLYDSISLSGGERVVYFLGRSGSIVYARNNMHVLSSAPQSAYANPSNSTLTIGNFSPDAVNPLNRAEGYMGKIYEVYFTTTPPTSALWDSIYTEILSKLAPGVAEANEATGVGALGGVTPSAVRNPTVSISAVQGSGEAAALLAEVGAYSFLEAVEGTGTAAFIYASGEVTSTTYLWAVIGNGTAASVAASAEANPEVSIAAVEGVGTAAAVSTSVDVSAQLEAVAGASSTPGVQPRTTHPILSDDALTQLHSWADLGHISDTKGNTWTMAGTVSYLPASGNIPEAWQFSNGSYFVSGSGNDAIDTTGSFTVIVIGRLPDNLNDLQDGAGVMLKNGSYGTNGWYTEMLSSGHVDIVFNSTKYESTGTLTGSSYFVLMAGRSGTDAYVRANTFAMVTYSGVNTTPDTTHPVQLGNYETFGYPALGGIYEVMFTRTPPSSSFFDQIWWDVSQVLFQTDAETSVQAVQGAAELGLISETADAGAALEVVQGTSSLDFGTSADASTEISAVSGVGSSSEAFASVAVQAFSEAVQGAGLAAPLEPIGDSTAPCAGALATGEAATVATTGDASTELSSAEGAGEAAPLEVGVSVEITLSAVEGTGTASQVYGTGGENGDTAAQAVTGFGEVSAQASADRNPVVLLDALEAYGIAYDVAAGGQQYAVQPLDPVSGEGAVADVSAGVWVTTYLDPVEGLGSLNMVGWSNDALIYAAVGTGLLGGILAVELPPVPRIIRGTGAALSNQIGGRSVSSTIGGRSAGANIGGRSEDIS